jgi:hypothetical protein
VPSSEPTRVPSGSPTCYEYGYEEPVYLGSACNYALLAKSGISTVPNSVITGDIAVSPIAGTALTGFSLTLDKSGQFATSTQVAGKLYGADYAVPTPATLTTAVLDMEGAYTEASGRTATRFTSTGSALGGQTMFPGVYTFTSGITIDADITFDGGPNDVFIVHTTGTLTQAANTKVLLSGCAQAKNIFWVSAGFTAINTNASMQGILLVKEKAVFKTGSSLVGSALAQTAVTLDMTTVTQLDDTCTAAPPTSPPTGTPTSPPTGSFV